MIHSAQSAVLANHPKTERLTGHGRQTRQRAKVLTLCRFAASELPDRSRLRTIELSIESCRDVI